MAATEERTDAGATTSDAMSLHHWEQSASSFSKGHLNDHARSSHQVVGETSGCGLHHFAFVMTRADFTYVDSGMCELSILNGTHQTRAGRN